MPRKNHVVARRTRLLSASEYKMQQFLYLEERLLTEEYRKAQLEKQLADEEESRRKQAIYEFAIELQRNLRHDGYSVIHVSKIEFKYRDYILNRYRVFVHDNGYGTLKVPEELQQMFIPGATVFAREEGWYEECTANS